ncbi:MAG: hypothetical protein RLZZ524_2909 [Pseudomonadota bacterium]|jgi:hypothetical protein
MIEHYLNDDARAFLDSFPSDADRDWSWQVIDLLCQRFPQTDHWTTGGVAFKYTDLRFGRRQRDKKAAHYVMFWLRSNKAGPYLQLGRDSGDNYLDARRHQGKYKIAVMRRARDAAMISVERWYPPPFWPWQYQQVTIWSGTAKRVPVVSKQASASAH